MRVRTPAARSVRRQLGSVLWSLGSWDSRASARRGSASPPVRHHPVVVSFRPRSRTRALEGGRHGRSARSSLVGSPASSGPRPATQGAGRVGRCAGADPAHHPHPEAALGDPAAFRLADAKLCVARSYGFPGWPDLISVVRALTDLRRDPPADDGSTVADRFCALACLRRTRRPFALERRPSPAERPGPLIDRGRRGRRPRRRGKGAPGRGPGGGPTHGRSAGLAPLLHLTYSRILAAPGVVTDPATEHAVLATADALLDAGADPNAGFLWLGLPTPFTALTGCFGGGEQGIRRQPPLPHGQALAERLLRAGAAPHDQQALYNRMFTPDDSHLELLLAYGLAGEDSAGAWRRRLGPALESSERVWARQLAWAADHGFDDRLDLLPGTGSPSTSPWSPVRSATAARPGLGTRPAAPSPSSPPTSTGCTRGAPCCTPQPGTVTWTGSGHYWPRVRTRRSRTDGSAAGRWTGRCTPSRPRPSLCSGKSLRTSPRKPPRGPPQTRSDPTARPPSDRTPGDARHITNGPPPTLRDPPGHHEGPCEGLSGTSCGSGVTSADAGVHGR
jgi:hypothetical protein